PRNEIEIDLLRFLAREYGPVSYERVLSGPGFTHVYRFPWRSRRSRWAANYVAGGIAPRFRAKLEGGSFVAAFRAEGRFAALMESIPVRLVLAPRTALLGAARVAQSLVE